MAGGPTGPTRGGRGGWKMGASLSGYKTVRGPLRAGRRGREGMAVTRKGVGGWGGLAQGIGVGLFAFGGAYWPLATAHSDPLWARTCFGCVNGAPG